LILIGDCWLDDDLSIRLPSEDRVAQLVSLKQTNPALRILITFMPENRLMSQLVCP
jgi:hypothetical protein